MPYCFRLKPGRAFFLSGWTEVGRKVEWLPRGLGVKNGLLERSVDLHLKHPDLCPQFVGCYLCFLICVLGHKFSFYRWKLKSKSILSIQKWLLDLKCSGFIITNKCYSLAKILCSIFFSNLSTYSLRTETYPYTIYLIVIFQLRARDCLYSLQMFGGVAFVVVCSFVLRNNCDTPLNMTL